MTKRYAVTRFRSETFSEYLTRIASILNWCYDNLGMRQDGWDILDASERSVRAGDTLNLAMMKLHPL